ncbi:hypothetical protein JD844_000052 [Phrynosoma platyrhinos]|uniref:Katanin p80 WD40 repeat-containing subunit B1 n=1 Tax=Phrynosoma platyrhinos TaxID=52577 RepID=A0ABQ7SQ45_PHRPL|nr:hypothetical protein JD844_000052 [Phrynosoma platyrhinos]
MGAGGRRSAQAPEETDREVLRKSPNNGSSRGHQDRLEAASNVCSLVLGKSSGRLLATGGDDCRVNIWSVNKPNCIMSLTGHTTPVESVKINTNEELIVAGSQSGSIRIWDLEAAKTLGCEKKRLCLQVQGIQLFQACIESVLTLQGHTQAVRCLRFSPDGKWLASSSDDHTVKLWDLAAGKIMFEFTGHAGPVNVVEFHPNEYLLASGSSDSLVWPICISVFPRCVLFNPDGCCLYAGCHDSLRVYGWEPERCFDVVLVNWGKVADLSICNNQLIGVSFTQSVVSSFVVDLNRVTKCGSGLHGLIRDDKPLTHPPPVGSSLRRIYERPSTTCSKPQR